MFDRYLDPFSHGATATCGIKQASAGERECLGVLRARELEDHRVLVEACKCLPIIFEAGHAKHFSRYCRRGCRKLSGDGIVLCKGIGRHSDFSFLGVKWYKGKLKELLK